VAHLVSSSLASAFLTNVSEKHKSTSPSAIQMKTGRMKNSIEEKLDVKNWPEEGEQIVDIHCIVRFTHSIVHTW